MLNNNSRDHFYYHRLWKASLCSTTSCHWSKSVRQRKPLLFPHLSGCLKSGSLKQTFLFICVCLREDWRSHIMSIDGHNVLTFQYWQTGEIKKKKNLWGFTLPPCDFTLNGWQSTWLNCGWTVDELWLRSSQRRSASQPASCGAGI